MSVESKIQGLREAKAAFQALPEIEREARLEATSVTAQMIVNGAQARILASPSVVTKALYDHITWSVTKTNGRGRVGVAAGSFTVTQQANLSRGVIGGRKIRVRGALRTTAAGRQVIRRPARYAHLVEFGSKKAAAEPFMIPAAEGQVQPHLQRLIAAGKKIERDVAAIGLRNL